MKFAENLKTFRLMNNLLQSDIASKLSIHQSNVSDWENGVTRPEYENLIALADIFDVSLDELLGRNFN